MPAYLPMPFHLETERLTLRPWAESDAPDFRDLLAARGKGEPPVERIRASIAEFLAATEPTAGEVAWLTRPLP
ncbi:hypothetical protein SAMN05216251_11437 [Actinacidiphila alni]|uniref:GNAT family N-acetyltransferase n=1 Tax=Actinacidiphila alni TaxID=380248 RepID=A0A1I2IQ97_9ACTN|nr:hypothetical protein SAMN05216251_11437 [Actinacidiphila alni]